MLHKTPETVSMLEIQTLYRRVDLREEITDQSLESKQALLSGLNAVCNDSTPQIKLLRDWLALQVEAEAPPLVIPPKKGREVLETRRMGAKVFQFEKVRCGKGNCKSCPHGPYWYGYQRKNKKLVSWYIGKELRPDKQSPPENK